VPLSTQEPAWQESIPSKVHMITPSRTDRNGLCVPTHDSLTALN
jgi:hypothetical protein